IENTIESSAVYKIEQELTTGSPNLAQHMVLVGGHRYKRLTVDHTQSSYFELEPQGLKIMPEYLPEDSEFEIVPYSEGPGNGSGPAYEQKQQGYSAVPTIPVDARKLPLPGTEVTLDVWVPDLPSQWVGDVQLTFELKPAGIDET